MAISYKARFADDMNVVSATGTTTLTGDLNVDGKAIDSVELSQLDGLTGNVQVQLDSKQDTLVSGTNIKTINGTSVLGGGNIVISGGTGGTVSAESIGLGNVDNTSDLNKPISTATQVALDLKANLATTYTKTETDTRIQDVVGAAPAALDTLKEIADQLASDESAVSALTITVASKAPLASPTFTGTVSGITAAMVGLGNVDNTADSAKPVSTAQQTALNAKQDTLVSGTNIKTINGTSVLGGGDIVITGGSGGTVTAASIGLGNVDNTSDLNKPISTATQTALDLKAPQATTYTKTETDDRIQAVVGAAPAALDTLKEIADQLAADESAVSALTTTVSTKANSADVYTKTDADLLLASKAPLASPTFTGTVSGITASMVGLGNVDNTSDSAKPVSTAQQTALNLKANLASPTFTGTMTTAGIKETSAAIAASAIDLSVGTFFTKTISATTTFTVSNVPASGLAGSFILELTNGGSQTVNWFSGVKWASGTAPTLTAAGVDILAFYTINGGTTWRGVLVAKDAK